MRASAPLVVNEVSFLAPFVAAGVFEHADVQVAGVTARAVPGIDDPVLLALALAVRATRQGHVCVVLGDIPGAIVVDDRETPEAATLDALPWPALRTWNKSLRASPAVRVAGGDSEGDEGALRPLVFDGGRVYLERYWRYEQMVGTDLLRRADERADGRASPAGRLPDTLLDHLFGPTIDARPDLQRAAAEAALTRRLVVVAGGPGTGKTRTVARLLAAAFQVALDEGRTLEVALAAPTGKAAARMTEAVSNEVAAAGLAPDLAAPLLATEASTIHRLLGPTGGLEFRHDHDDPLTADVVVVDEASMVSLPLMARLLDAVRPDARLVLVGDPYQLASIEAGAVLGDVVGPAAVVGWGGELPLGPLAGGVVVLERVHRFDADSSIAALGDAVRAGDAETAMDLLRSDRHDLTWVRPDESAAMAAVEEQVVDAALEVARAALAADRAGGLAASNAVKVLAATRNGPLGTYDWRDRVERRLLQIEPRLRAGRQWYIGRPVIVTRNDYLNGLLNGDTGLVVATEAGSAVVFPRGDTTRDLQPSQLAQVETWWSMTIHKSQGSEFRHVVVSLPKAGSPILTRELLYTGVTRAREQLTIVADEAAIRAAVNRTVARASGLQARLWP